MNDAARVRGSPAATTASSAAAAIENTAPMTPRMNPHVDWVVAMTKSHWNTSARPSASETAVQPIHPVGLSPRFNPAASMSNPSVVVARNCARQSGHADTGPCSANLGSRYSSRMPQ